jgi:hypothetical protein
MDDTKNVWKFITIFLSVFLLAFIGIPNGILFIAHYRGRRHISKPKTLDMLTRSAISPDIMKNEIKNNPVLNRERLTHLELRQSSSTSMGLRETIARSTTNINIRISEERTKNNDLNQ